MTYKNLLDTLKLLTEEELELDVTILIDTDDYHPIQRLVFTDKNNGTLDEGHPVLVV